MTNEETYIKIVCSVVSNPDITYRHTTRGLALYADKVALEVMKNIDTRLSEDNWEDAFPMAE